MEPLVSHTTLFLLLLGGGGWSPANAVSLHLVNEPLRVGLHAHQPHLTDHALANLSTSNFADKNNAANYDTLAARLSARYANVMNPPAVSLPNAISPSLSNTSYDPFSTSSISSSSSASVMSPLDALNSVRRDIEQRQTNNSFPTPTTIKTLHDDQQRHIARALDNVNGMLMRSASSSSSPSQQLAPPSMAEALQRYNGSHRNFQPNNLNNLSYHGQPFADQRLGGDNYLNRQAPQQGPYEVPSSRHRVDESNIRQQLGTPFTAPPSVQMINNNAIFNNNYNDDDDAARKSSAAAGSAPSPVGHVNDKNRIQQAGDTAGNKDVKTEEDLVEAIKEIIAEMYREKMDDDFDVTVKTEFDKDLQMDSLDTMEILVRLEKRHGIQLDEEHLEGAETVGHVVDAAKKVRFLKRGEQQTVAVDSTHDAKTAKMQTGSAAKIPSVEEDELVKKIKGVFAEAYKEKKDEDYHITVDTKFDEDLEMDSLDTMEILVRLEKETNVQVDEESMANIRTVGDLIEQVKTQKQHEVLHQQTAGDPNPLQSDQQHGQ